MGHLKTYLLIILTCASACFTYAQSYDVYSKTDTIKDQSVNYLRLNTLPSKGNAPVITFNPGFVRNGKNIQYQVSINYLGRELIFIDKNYSLTIITDSTDISLKLDPTSKSNKRQTNEIGQIFHDISVTYSITLWQLLQMRESEFLSLEIKGLKKIAKAEFSNANVKIFRKYFREEIVPAVETVLNKD